MLARMAGLAFAGTCAALAALTVAAQATPEVPADRVEALRAAFDQLLQDPDFKAKMEKRGIPVTEPTSGAEATKIVRESLMGPPETIERAKTLIATK